MLSDADILKGVKEGRILIDPFKKRNIQPASYDLKLATKVRVFRNHSAGFVDVKKPVDITEIIDMKKGGSFIVHPGEFILGATEEYVTLPNDVAATLEGRSSIGRLGLIVHATAGFIDPGFSGTITLEITNLSRLPIKIYAGMRISQLAFYQMSSPVRNPYGSKALKSKYQGQRDPTVSHISKDFEKK